jgi:MFS family permease
MQSSAQGFLVFQLTRSPVYLGYVGFAVGMPSWLLMLYGGVVADRVPRRTLLLITQTSMMVLAFVLAALTFTGRVQAWHIVALATCLGVANAFDTPTRQSFAIELVPRDDLTNAIALNATMFNTATALGPAAAGITYALLGPAWCFTINGISFLAVITALTRMRLPIQTSRVRTGSVGADVREGVRYALSQTSLRVLIAAVGTVHLLGMAVVTLIPAWTVKILHGTAITNGLLHSARGVGAVASALLIAGLGHNAVRGRLLTVGTFVIPLALLALTVVPGTPLTLLALAVVGAGMTLVMNLANAMVQSQVPDALRGRVMSIYALVSLGALPLGALWVGTIAEHLGERAAVDLNAVLLLGASLGLWLFAGWLRKTK